ncbi:MAG TPA: polyphosphate kinase 2 family protein [Nitrososphaera sp.]|nr:polyphosphate kinase 2 family protein [Nitrososphaera sp.]
MTIDESRFRIKPGSKVRLADYDPADTRLMPDKTKAEAAIAKEAERLEELQERLYAEHLRSLRIVLQGMDASGKDGTIKHVMRGLNPQACTVVSFKVPAGEELDHDFLWRIESAMPRKGYIGVFNRSQYEDVLAARVHKLVPAKVWKERYGQINRFEELKSELGTTILKFFLHISKDEQKRRLEERLASPRKNWKFSMADVTERKLWNEYQKAYEDALTKCSTKWAAWYIVPSNHKWYRNWMVARTILEKLESLDPEYPPPKVDLSKIRIK